MRERRGTNPGVPPTSGKRVAGRDRRHDELPARGLRIRYTPRPHTTVWMGPYEIPALIDTGSEISLISAETARKAQHLKIRPREEGGRTDPHGRRVRSRAPRLRRSAHPRF